MESRRSRLSVPESLRLWHLVANDGIIATGCTSLGRTMLRTLTVGAGTMLVSYVVGLLVF